jgi:hypothetical protein
LGKSRKSGIAEIVLVFLPFFNSASRCGGVERHFVALRVGFYYWAIALQHLTFFLAASQFLCAIIRLPSAPVPAALSFACSCSATFLAKSACSLARSLSGGRPLLQAGFAHRFVTLRRRRRQFGILDLPLCIGPLVNELLGLGDTRHSPNLQSAPLQRFF